MNEERKRLLLIVAAVIGLVVAAIAAGWIYYSLNPTAWSSFTADLSGEGAEKSSRAP